MIGVCFVEPPDHVRRFPEVLCHQPYALFCRVSFVLDSVAERVIAVRTLEDLFKFVLFFAVNLNRWRWLGRATPVKYIRLE